MKKNRTIPFGYMMKNGEIEIEPVESNAVQEIFKLYLDGSSLLTIAGYMKSQNVSYNGINNIWNKNMVKRILENEKYIGKENYPRVIDDEIFFRANAKKKVRASMVAEISEELQSIRSLTYCSECGHRMSRIGGNTRPEKWNCKNPDCSKFEYRITDNMLRGVILNVLNTVIANPEMLETDTEISSYTPSLEVTRQQNEISRIIESSDVDFDKAKDEILYLAQMKYDCCTYNDKPLKTEHLTNIFADKQQLNMIDIDLLKSCVSRIEVSHFYTIEIEFINGVTIKNVTERTEKNDNSTKCDDNSCQSSDG